MVLIRVLLLGLLVLGIGAPSGAWAHKNHQRAAPHGAQPAAPHGTQPAVPPGAAAMPPSEMQQQMEAHAEAMAAQEPKTFLGRLTSWFGRMHPFAVHFPIALFPVALVALVLARRRGDAVELIRALIIVAGAGSLVGAVLGWLNGGFTLTDGDGVLMAHRWLGTFLGLLGAVVGWWAWRRRSAVDSKWMVATLGLTVLLLLVQGFLGASVTHGWEHMMF